ncbi:ATP-binding cassette, subfamily B [Fibrobacter sp. UWB16]|uniref:ABC transporter ATP-binding protein n=1 Tax=unclassified Fibrobacter TaxID=2634177 RepID=UPI000B526D1A|nr:MULTISPECIES: ABC transporter ATP-binding protein [unclassified Fibrobacter]OWV19306.1 ABC transporter ATP-binding protein [Fibrobacter sp. UWB3]SOD15874.1 ATP-binding cassette, subfamily B [Fibrobacter sp. UWB16]
MYNWIKNRFVLSDEGTKTFIKGVFWTTWHYLSLMLPLSFVFLFLKEFMAKMQNPSAEPHNFWVYIAIAVVIYLVMYFIYALSYDSTYESVYSECKKRRITLAEKLRKLPLSFFGKKDLSDLTSTIMNDVNALEMIFSHAVPEIFAVAAMLVICAVALIIYNPLMAAALLWVAPFAGLLIYLSRKLQFKNFKHTYNAARVITEDIQESLENIQEIKSYCEEESVCKALDDHSKFYEHSQIKGEFMSGVILNGAQIFLKLGLASVLIFGSILLAQDKLSIFDYLVYIVCASTIYSPIYLVLNNITELFFLDVRLKRFKEMDDMEVQRGSTKFEPADYDIEFKNVDFYYNEEKQVLKKASFTAKQGEITALVGPSGSGKTTAAKLAARFWDIQGGTITLGGQDISRIDPETLLKNFSIVFQDVVLFNTSIRDNIRIGKRDATDEEILRAAKLANCDDFVQKLPQGYDTVIGENGDTLSGGERQRISIARAILKDAPIVLLDEATASLDVENESKIQQSISELVQNKTVIIIAHRMRTIANADKVVVLQNGQVIETGSPAELKAKGGLFGKMLKLQEVN